MTRNRLPIPAPPGTQELALEQVTALGWMHDLLPVHQARLLERHTQTPQPSAAEAFAAGFTHRDGGNGTGFEAGGQLDQMLPGAQLGAQVATARRDLRALPDDVLAGVLCGNRRQLSWHQATEYELIAELDRRRARADGREGEFVDDELASVLTETGRSARMLLEDARQLERLAAARTLLANGILSTRQAQLITRHLELLPDEHAAAVLDDILPRAGEMTTGRLGDALKAAIKRVDPQAAHNRKEKARQDARVECYAEDAGTAALAGRDLDPAQAIAADKKIRAFAWWLKDHGAEGTVDQISAKVFLALLNSQPLHTLLPATSTTPGEGTPGNNTAGSGTADDNTAGGNSAGGNTAGSWPGTLARLPGIPTVHMTMPVSAYAGTSQAPGHIDGYGAADASTCRDLTGQLTANPATRWCITLIDPQGRAVGHGCARAGPGLPGTGEPRSWLASITIHPIETGTCQHRREAPGYRIPDSLRHIIKIRSPRCGFPGCRRPATRCDDDHTIAFHKGGRTCECNLHPLCRRHHRCKQAPGWHLDQPEPGQLTWTTPNGRTCTTTAEPYPV